MDFISPLAELGLPSMPASYPYYNASDATDPANFVSVVWVDSSGTWRVGAHQVFTAPYNWDREVAEAAANGLAVVIVSEDAAPNREDIPGTPEYAAKYSVPDQDGNYYLDDGSYAGNVTDSLAPGVPRIPEPIMITPIDDPSYPFPTGNGPMTFPPIDDPIPPVELPSAPPENSPTSENGTQMPPSATVTRVPEDTPTLGVGITVSPWVLAGAAALLYFMFMKPRRR